MDNIWLASALWIGLALIACVAQAWVAVSIIDAKVVRRHFWSSMSIGLVGFLAPYLGVVVYAHFILAWPWPQAQIAAIALSTTSVAVVYAVMVETGFNQTEIGKIILTACFVNDLGTVLALGIVFANYNLWLAAFSAVTALTLILLPSFAPWSFAKLGPRVSEPQIKFVLLVLFGLGGLAGTARSEAVLPAYLVGMVMAPTFLDNRELTHRIRVIAFAVLTPFYFLKAGSLVRADAIVAAAGLIAMFLAVKMATKILGILPLTRLFRFEPRDGMYTTLMMSTGLTFGSIAALFGLTNNIIDERYIRSS
jgi:Kef-type K+ transport system membrane component KefB